MITSFPSNLSYFLSMTMPPNCVSIPFHFFSNVELEIQTEDCCPSSLKSLHYHHLDIRPSLTGDRRKTKGFYLGAQTLINVKFTLKGIFFENLGTQSNIQGPWATGLHVSLHTGDNSIQVPRMYPESHRVVKSEVSHKFVHTPVI